MARPTNTLVTTGHVAPAGIGMREDLSAYARLMSPQETPIFSWMGEGKATNSVAHEWQTISLRAPSKNAQPEGNQFVPTAPKTTARLVNTCQIAYEVAAVSGTAEAVDTAGAMGDIDEQMLYKTMELKRDLEFNPVCANQVRKATDPRESAGLMNFISAATADVGSGGTDPTGDGATLLVEGTPRALTTDLLLNVMETMWTEGAKPTLAAMPPGQKRKFDNLEPGSNLADNTYNLPVSGAPGVVMDVSVSIFKTSFGTLRILLDQWMDPSTILIFDEREEYKPKKCPLPGRNFVKGNPQLNHDGKSQAVIWEGTIEVSQPSAVGLVAALS